jgi:hypothetical protein
VSLGFVFIKDGKATYEFMQTNEVTTSYAGIIKACEIAKQKWPEEKIFCDHIGAAQETGSCWIDSEYNKLARRTARKGINHGPV